MVLTYWLLEEPIYLDFIGCFVTRTHFNRPKPITVIVCYDRAVNQLPAHLLGSFTRVFSKPKWENGTTYTIYILKTVFNINLSTLDRHLYFNCSTHTSVSSMYILYICLFVRSPSVCIFNIVKTVPTETWSFKCNIRINWRLIKDD